MAEESLKVRDREAEIVSDPDENRPPVKPIRYVERTLTRPDGTTVTVEVPVYPPYEIKPLASRANGIDPKTSKSRNN
ncbi:hypothetical protein MK489_15080 [Myxococcota bacterium]|nr:hypothetical protein [Myxococcota bacterium]